MMDLTSGLDHGIDCGNKRLRDFAIGIPVVFVGLLFALRLFGIAPEPMKSGTRRSDMIAYQVTSSVPTAYMAAMGFISIFELFGVDDMYTEPLLSDKYYAKSDFIINEILYPMLVYQTWNFIACLIFSEIFKFENLAHHIAAGE